MKFKEHVFGLTAAATAGVSYFICAGFFYLWPNTGFQIHSFILHLANIEKYSADFRVTLTGFVMGMLHVVFYSYFMGYLFAWFHNYFTKNKY